MSKIEKFANMTTLMDDIHNDIKTTFIEQTEFNIPTLKRDYTDKTITAEELNGEYNTMIKEMTDLQEKMNKMKLKIEKQDKKIEDISFNIKN